MYWVHLTGASLQPFPRVDFLRHQLILFLLGTWQHRANFRPNFFHRPATTGGNKDSKAAQKGAEGETDESFITDEKEVWFVGCHTGTLLLLRMCDAQINRAQMSAEVQHRTQIQIPSLTFHCAG